MAKINKEKGVQIELNEVKKMIREEITTQYGSIPAFFSSDKVKKIGGAKLRSYIYDKGATSFSNLGKLCQILGIGILSRKIAIVRTTNYYLVKKSTD